MGTESCLKCPGLELALTIIPELIPCPCCGAEIEIWTDEKKARCGRCGGLINREYGQGIRNGSGGIMPPSID
jgi:Zn finger protein HypA/HybF involved in hydrogenase expression